MTHPTTPTKGYLLSFTAASLSVSDSVRIAELYLSQKDWSQVRKLLQQENLLQSRTSSRTTRVAQELIKRLVRLSPDQLGLLVEGTLSEQKYLLWYAVCKTYAFIDEFSREVLHEKFLARNLLMTDLDYDAFFNRKSEWNDKLQNVTEKTRKKIRQVTFLMMKEAELISMQNEILRAMLSNRLMEVLRPEAPKSFQIFPVDSP